MLVSNALLSEDYSKTMIEMVYMSSYIDPTYSIEKWMEEIDKVSKIDIIKMANLLKLQTVYFLEGK